MASLQSFDDWQAANQQADVARRAVCALVQGRVHPTQVQMEEVVRLRVEAIDKLRAMVLDVKAKGCSH